MLLPLPISLKSNIYSNVNSGLVTSDALSPFVRSTLFLLASSRSASSTLMIFLLKIHFTIPPPTFTSSCAVTQCFYIEILCT